jgi:hypothetical protein
VRRFDIRLYACDILQDHVHLVPARRRENVEFICRVMKSAATRRLTALGIHPLREYADATGRAPTPRPRGVKGKGRRDRNGGGVGVADRGDAAAGARGRGGADGRPHAGGSGGSG